LKIVFLILRYSINQSPNETDYEISNLDDIDIDRLEVEKHVGAPYNSLSEPEK